MSYFNDKKEVNYFEMVLKDSFWELFPQSNIANDDFHFVPAMQASERVSLSL